MKSKIVFLLTLTILAGTFLLPSRGGQPEVRLPLSFDHYYTYDMLNEALKKLAKAFPKLTNLETIGKSDEGREIMCLTLNNPATGPETEKPAVYVDGNIHGNEIQAGEVCLYLLDHLLHNYGSNPEITEVVDRNCFYVIPCVNPDGRYHFLADGNTSSSNRSLRIPKDDDNDGLVDEDFPDDLDSDGNICQMRRKNPFGRFKTDPEDPRLMIPVKPGEKGEWETLGQEGIDNDQDGMVNEDTEGYLDGNRNWSYDWQPEYAQSGAGDYPFEGVGLKAIASFIRSKPNICIGWTFHNNGGMYLRGPSSKAQREYPQSDIAVYDHLGQNAERITPGYRYMISWKDLYPTHGDSMEWLVMLNGVYGFVGELFQTETETFQTRKEEQKKKGLPEEEEDGMARFMSQDNSQARQRLLFNDHLVQGELYKPWKPFKHPLYGDIEIGGWVKMSSRLPAPFMLKDLVHRNASVVIFSAKNTPRVRMEIFEKKRIGNDLFRLRIRLANDHAVPSMSQTARQSKLYPEDMLTVSGTGIKVTAAGQLLNSDTDQVRYKEYRPEIQFLAVPGFGKIEYQFLVSGNGPVQIDYTSRHAGKISKKINLTD